jgi:hypothetical protein
MKKWIFYLLISFLFLPVTARAEFFPSIRPALGTSIYLMGSYVSYQDLKTSSGASEVRNQGYLLNLGLRMFYIFNFELVGVESVDAKQTALGAGIRAHVPGFFFLGGKTQELMYRSRDMPFNTSMYAQILYNTRKVSSTDSATQVENVFGLSMDLFVVTKTFLTVSVFTSSYNSNFYLGTSGGIGFEF